MPSSYITSAQKTMIESVIDNVHETFGRNITVFGEGRKVLIAASDEYNGVYGRTGSGATSTTVTAVTHTIKARIKYIKMEEEKLADGSINSQMGIELIDGSVKITVDSDGYDILKEAKRCEFEGKKYSISSKGRPEGIFGPKYYEFFLKPLEE